MGHHQSHSTEVDVDILQRARASVVCGLLQPDCRLHRSLWHSGTINRPMPHSSILPCVPTTVLVSCSISVWCSTNACGQWHNCAITVHTFSSCWLQNCKVALLTFKVHSMLMPSYLCRLIQYRQRGHNMQSATMMLSTCHKCAYQCSALAVKWPNYEVTIHQTSFNYI